MLIGESGSQKRRHRVKSIHMRPSVATTWSNAKDISYFDFTPTPWNVLSCYLESLLQELSKRLLEAVLRLKMF
ncbi:hypothetical protein HanRHA438_Chr09g0401391 [Helianthus annuus]|uniref:Uncharacterized protein n=2 Tax=Helianthus annuus TaxID=4232 RepID=A0A9K3N8N1_HELAN|nr:hypothetical protein HanXRQr2_Chr09g0389881 [Helianthus annuus]KAJ0526140.1 hypothetical protein HanHA300_Chr09g0319931 [Helianthus annuus]KAJ0534489.1 hypothetical protein HanIR_Chr09g0420371 [Helianthus annuus]KAJ0542532.1 hypothetical protein HanHA89_Chr09g0340851 [Helianthus annuus]KAJ0707581.1 hypothetical protein HanLR1_Chr09g0320101 [Helianthus annuus]